MFLAQLEARKMSLIILSDVHSAEQASMKQPGVAITRTFRQKTGV
jgi:hypothetical protein